MNKGMIWVVIAVIVIIVAGGGYYLYAKSTSQTMMHDAMQKSDSMMKSDTSMKGDNKMVPSTTGMMGMSGPAMMMHDAKLGNILTDTKNMTLYTYDKDTQNQSNCTSQCAVNWPPYTVTGTVPASLPAHVGTITRADGATQYTWDGKPLYYYIQDTKAGDITGDGVGGVWHVVK